MKKISFVLLLYTAIVLQNIDAKQANNGYRLFGSRQHLMGRHEKVNAQGRFSTALINKFNSLKGTIFTTTKTIEKPSMPTTISTDTPTPTTTPTAAPTPTTPTSTPTTSDTDAPNADSPTGNDPVPRNLSYSYVEQDPDEDDDDDYSDEEYNALFNEDDDSFDNYENINDFSELGSSRPPQWRRDMQQLLQQEKSRNEKNRRYRIRRRKQKFQEHQQHRRKFADCRLRSNEKRHNQKSRQQNRRQRSIQGLNGKRSRRNKRIIRIKDKNLN